MPGTPLGDGSDVKETPSTKPFTYDTPKCPSNLIKLETPPPVR